MVGDADSDAKKQALFEKVRQGAVRVLIGSTSKMGTGTNVQKRLVAMHHLDAPWKPAEVEQRDGRILRQGNTNAEVSIYRYVTEGSFDAYMWQALETKARFIAQIMTGESGLRRAEDVAGQELSYAEVNRIPDQVDRIRYFPVGTYRGLTFGIQRHPGGSADVYVEGRLSRTTMLSKDAQGPRAVMNALHRIVGSYAEERDRAEREKALAETQLGDYEARLGRPFAHTAYLDELTRLRDQLKVALSGTPPAEGAEAGPSAADLADQIKALRAGYAVEAAPARVKPVRAEEVKPRRRAEVIELQKEEPIAPEPEPETPVAPPVEKPPVTFRQMVRSRPVQQSLF